MIGTIIPQMLVPPMKNPSELWLQRDHKHDLAFRPLETVTTRRHRRCHLHSDWYNSNTFRRPTGEIKAIENLANFPDWTIQGANIPATCTSVTLACQEHPELVVAL